MDLEKMTSGETKQTNGVGELQRIAAHLRDLSNKFPSANKLCVFCSFKAQLDYDLMAKNLGFERTGARSHGQPIYRRGNEYISPDVDRHNGVSGRRPPAMPPNYATRQRATARSMKT
jgi:hypothetical protein